MKHYLLSFLMVLSLVSFVHAGADFKPNPVVGSNPDSGIVVVTTAEAALITSCTPLKPYIVSDAPTVRNILRRCTIDGDAIEESTEDAQLAIPGLASDDSGIKGLKFSNTTASASRPLGEETVIEADLTTSGFALTLPPLVSSPVSQYIIIITAGTNTLTILPFGAELLAGVNEPQTISGVRSTIIVRKVTGGWHVIKTAVAASSSLGKGSIILHPQSVRFPASNPGVLDNSTLNGRVLFDNTTPQCVFWSLVAPQDYSSTPKFDYQYSMVSVTSGSHHLDISLWVMSNDGDDVDTESYGSANDCNDSAVPAQAGDINTVSDCALTNDDSLVAGKMFMIRACRDTANDDAAGVSEFRMGRFTYVRVAQ